MNYDDTFEGFFIQRMNADAETNRVSSEWLMVSQNEEYERFLLAEYDKQFG